MLWEVAHDLIRRYVVEDLKILNSYNTWHGELIETTKQSKSTGLRKSFFPKKNWLDSNPRHSAP